MSPTERPAWPIVLMVLMTLATACGRQGGSVLTDTSTAGGRSAAPAATEQANEAERRVKAALSADTVLRAFELEADEEKGEIVIEGTVRTAQQKALAEQVATRAAGGLTVVNRIRVQ